MQPKAHTDILEQALEAMPDTFPLDVFLDKAVELRYPVESARKKKYSEWLQIYAMKLRDGHDCGDVWRKIAQPRTDIKEAIALLERSGYVVSKKGCDRPVTINIKSLIGEANVTTHNNREERSETARFLDQVTKALQDAVNDATRS